MYIEKINSPKDLKNLSLDDLRVLADEVRQHLITKVSNNGGHSGPNFGVVELTVALHYVFNSPVDKLVFDVSHQAYAHKMLTGRKDAFMDPSKYHSVSGFTNPKESEHDFFTIGHTSTSVSLACGLAKARDLKGDKENIVAIIGDGSLSGGEAYEGLNNAVELDSNLIVVVNDNDMSIAPNKGGLYRNLKELRETKGQAKDNFFKSLGFDYYYVDGHCLTDLVRVFNEVKDSKKPVVVHVYTIKGKGFKFAEENKEKFHAGRAFSLETGKYVWEDAGRPKSMEDYTNEFLLKKIKEDSRVVALNAGTPGIIGLDNPEKRAEFGPNFVDVGIAEETAVAMTSGLAKNGAKPVYACFSTFLQRTYDQISHDLCLNNNSGVILNFLASVYGMSDETHLGIFDIPLVSHIPNMVYLAPTNNEEYFAMLNWAIEQNEHPVTIRVPVKPIITGVADKTDYSVLNKYQVVNQGKDIAIIAMGNFFELGQDIVKELSKHDINATLINPKFISGLDIELLESLKENHQLVITLEDGILEGGFGQTIASYYGPSKVQVKNYGLAKAFHDRYKADQLLRDNGISVDQITDDVLNLLK